MIQVLNSLPTKILGIYLSYSEQYNGYFAGNCPSIVVCACGTLTLRHPKAMDSNCTSLFVSDFRKNPEQRTSKDCGINTNAILMTQVSQFWIHAKPIWSIWNRYNIVLIPLL